MKLEEKGRLVDVFKDINLDEELSIYFADSEVEELNFDEDNKSLTVNLLLNKIVAEPVLKKLSIKIKYSLNQVVDDVFINERYELVNDYSSEKLFMLYKPCLLAKLKEKSPYMWSRLKGKTPSINDGVLSYELNDLDFKYAKGRSIEDMINEILSFKLGGALKIALSRDEEPEMIEKLTENLEKFKKEMEEEENKVIAENVKTLEKTVDTKDNYKLGRLKKDLSKIKIKDIIRDIDEAYFEGEIIRIDEIITKKKACIIKISLTDYTDSITCTIYKGNLDDAGEILANINKGYVLDIYGEVGTDKFSKDTIVRIKYLSVDKNKKIRELVDDEKEKRIELSFHTKMSDMDGIVFAKDAVKAASKMGHKAIAITDNDVVQSFHQAHYAIPKGSDFKVIYGCQMNMVDDLKKIVKHSNNENLSDNFVVFDLETTGFYARKDKITEIGAVKIINGNEVDSFSSFVNPTIPIPVEVTELTNITNEMVSSAPLIEEILPEFLDFVGDSVLVAHNSDFDMSFIYKQAREIGRNVNNTVLDTLELARVFYTDMKNYQLKTLAKYFNVPLNNAHRAVHDAAATSKVFINMLDKLRELGINSTDDINKYAMSISRASNKLRPSKVTVLVKNQKGLDSLYELVSKAHIDYFYRQAKIPKSELVKLRDDLIIMSGNYEGEIFKLLLNDRNEEEIIEQAKFYDYLEVQPALNNKDLVNKGVFSSIEDLEDLNKKIVEIGDLIGKKVVATGDVRFLYPEDKISRDLILFGRNFLGSLKSGDYYFRNTRQMLDEFSFLPTEKACEIVIENTHKVYDEIGDITPINPDKCPPKIEGSDDDLRKICYEKAREIYGDSLPEIVESRLKKELDSIISNGYSVMYIIANKLVAKSEEDGYLVGSRGSVGSSFAATMSSITEVNPLPPHYYCKKCKYSDFDSEIVKSYSGRSGFELPEKTCPNCGELLNKDGQDIPFETFLGFKGDKEPDIDLNFSGEYQANAHSYTAEIFGKENIFRAGTIGEVKEKTAMGILIKYIKEKDLSMRNAEMERIVSGMIGVRRTTGQHPGGIVVLPKGDSIYRFTPVQKPANKMGTDIITTHFDYHSIDSNLLKLDILGHDDPTIIRILEDITGIDPKGILFDDKKVLSLFADTSALGISPDDINGVVLGCLGVPEFGTDFVIEMVKDTKPKGFSDLVRISGLSHGTDVWLNNAQELIRKNKANISEIISTRDDIMVYLISMGVEHSLSFKIMESVRKGKGLTEDMEAAMKEKKVPEWYIWSCKQIKYMFPKAHAVAYVMMAFRIAYYKVYYPRAYYIAFFSIRAGDFDYEIMAKGLNHLRAKRMELNEKAKFEKLSKKENDVLKDMKVVEEMYARGIEFLPIDISRVKAKYFQIIDDKIMPSLTSISGLGDNVAEIFVEEREKKPYSSIEDIKKRGKINNTTIAVMKECGILDGIPESNQISLFDLM